MSSLVTRNRHVAEAALRPWTPAFTHGDLQIAHVFIDDDEITGVIDWTEAGPGDALYDLATLTLGHEEHLGDLLAGYGTDVDLDMIRAYWSLRSLLAVRWLAEHGFDPSAPGAEVDVAFSPLADRWNGHAWTQVTPPVPARSTTSDLGAVSCSGTTACTAVGSSAQGSRAQRLLAERWNGSAWKMQPIPEPAGGGLLQAVACPATHACRAVGFDAKGLFSELWNGSSWVVRPVPLPAGGTFPGLNGISCTAADSCEAVGSYDNGGTFLPLAEVWNGSRWRLQAPSTVAGAAAAGLDDVSCLSATDCEAAGYAQTTASTEVGLLEKWNGTKWSLQKKVLPAGDTAARLNGISCITGPVCETVGFHEASAHLLALRYSSR